MMGLDSDSEDDNCLNWQLELQSHRVYIIRRVEYRTISAALQSRLIFDHQDDEEIKNNHINPTSNDKTNRMLDKLLRKGEQNYAKFIRVLGDYYPDIYKLMKGEDPPPTDFPVPPDDKPNPDPDDSSRMDIINILFEKLDKKKKECEDLFRQNNMRERDLEDKGREISDLHLKIGEMQRRSERYESMERDMTALKDVVDHVKNEHLKVCMRLVDANEETSRLREHNMALRVENDKLKVKIRQMESTVSAERSVSVRLRHKIETGPTLKRIHSLQQEIENYKLKLAQTDSDRHMQNNNNDIDTRLQILQGDKEEALQMYSEASENLNKLRDEFHSAETLRDKYLEETERLQLEVSALKDDCEMYKTRRDSVWQQLQEVEKERDQLMKERNEAQMTAQNHMDEKTKYRSQIRKLEEEHDNLSQKLREKENTLLKFQRKLTKRRHPALPGPAPASTTSESSTSSNSTEPPKPDYRRYRCFNIKYFPESVTKSEFAAPPSPNTCAAKSDGIFPEIHLAGNYGNDCGKYTVGKLNNSLKEDPPNGIRRKGMRKKRNDSRQAQAGSMTKRNNSETQSRTSSTDSPYQRKLDESSNGVVMEIEAESLKKCVKLIGGNQSGIFVNQVIESPTCAQTCISLQPGMQILKVCSFRRRPIKVDQWTLEYINNILQNLEGTVFLNVEVRMKEFQDLKDTMKNSRMTGDSFYVRANFKWNADEMLNFNKYEVLHVISTQAHAEMHWLACKVDLYNGNNASKCDIIPSYKYCVKHPMREDKVITKGRRFTEPNLFPVLNDNRELFTSSFKVSNQKPSCSQLVIGRQESSYDPVGQPYTLIRAVPSAKEKPRPCLLLPQLLSKILSFKLTTIAEPLMFDFPVPESVNCSVNSVRSRLYDRDVVSFNFLSNEKQEIVTTNSVQKTANMGKHCILSINENCISIKEYLRKLQAEDIHPIVILLHTDTKKTVRSFIEEDKHKPNVVIQDMILTGEQLKRFACNFVTVNLDRCNRVEEAAQFIMEKVADETNRIVWQEEENEICI